MRKEYVEMSNEYRIDNREWQLWKPIFSIAKTIDTYVEKFFKAETKVSVENERL